MADYFHFPQKNDIITLVNKRKERKMNKRLNQALALGAAVIYCLVRSAFALAAAEPDALSIKTTQVHEPAREDGGPTGESRPEGEGGLKINDILTLKGLFEVDAIVARDFTGADTSTIELTTVELALDAKAAEWASGLIVVTYDGEEDDLYLDEANITLGGTEEFPLFLTAGRVYVPFGYFATNMLQDPLTQTIGEVNVSGVIGGLEVHGVRWELFGYQGMDETGEEESVAGLGSALTYTHEQDETALNTGIAWINNIADAEGINDTLNDTGIDTVFSRVNGLRIHFDGRQGAFSLIGEYTAALDSFAPEELAESDNGGESGAQPAAWNSELAYATEILARETVIAAGYQGSREAVALGLPEQRLIAAVSMEVFDGASLSLEYYLDQDYSVADGGTDEKGYGLTTRFTYVF